MPVLLIANLADALEFPAEWRVAIADRFLERDGLKLRLLEPDPGKPLERWVVPDAWLAMLTAFAYHAMGVPKDAPDDLDAQEWGPHVAADLFVPVEARHPVGVYVGGIGRLVGSSHALRQEVAQAAKALGDCPPADALRAALERAGPRVFETEPKDMTTEGQGLVVRYAAAVLAHLADRSLKTGFPILSRA